MADPWGHPDLIEGLGAAAANLRTYEWGGDLAEHCDTAARLLTDGPPTPPEIVAIVREYQQARDEWNSLPDDGDDDALVERVGLRLDKAHEALIDLDLSE